MAELLEPHRPTAPRTVSAQRAREDEHTSRNKPWLIDEGLKTSAHPRIVCRDGRAGGGGSGRGPGHGGVSGCAANAPARRGDARVGEAAKQLDLPELTVRLRCRSAAANPDEIEAFLRRNEEAARPRRAGSRRASASGLVEVPGRDVRPAVAMRLTEPRPRHGPRTRGGLGGLVRGQRRAGLGQPPRSGSSSTEKPGRLRAAARRCGRRQRMVHLARRASR